MESGTIKPITSSLRFFLSLFPPTQRSTGAAPLQKPRWEPRGQVSDHPGPRGAFAGQRVDPRRRKGEWPEECLCGRAGKAHGLCYHSLPFPDQPSKAQLTRLEWDFWGCGLVVPLGEGNLYTSEENPGGHILLQVRPDSLMAV